MGTFKDMSREEKDEVIKAMKNPNWEENFLTRKQQEVERKWDLK